MLIAQTRLKLRTSNLTKSSQGQSGRDRQKFIQKGAWPGSRDSLNFGALNANNSKTIKAKDFKFGTSVPRDSPDMTPKNFSKRGVARVT